MGKKGGGRKKGPKLISSNLQTEKGYDITYDFEGEEKKEKKGASVFLLILVG